jgi:hypothetical protein
LYPRPLGKRNLTKILCSTGSIWCLHRQLELHIVEAQIQARAVYQLRSYYQLIPLDFICPLEYRTTPPFGWPPEIPGEL